MVPYVELLYHKIGLRDCIKSGIAIELKWFEYLWVICVLGCFETIQLQLPQKKVTNEIIRQESIL